MIRGFRFRVRRLFLAVPLATGCSQAPPPIVPFPSPPARPVMVYLGRLDQAPIDPPLRGSLRRWLGDAPGFLQTPLARPFGLATAGHRLLICDPPQGCVWVIDYDAQEARSLDDLGKPVAVCVGADGRTFVADARSGRIHVFDRELYKLPTIAPPSPKFRPVALVASGERLFVADMMGKCVRPYDLAESRWDDPVPSDQPLGYPAGLCVAQGRLWLSDALDGRLLAAELPRGSLHAVPGPPSRLRPKHFASADGGRLVVTDAALQRLQLIDADGRTRLEIADASILPLPSGVCLSRELVSFYTKRLPAGFRAAAIVFVSNQSGPPGVAVFALAAPVDTNRPATAD